jgi:large subunit ribosomal protein L15
MQIHQIKRAHAQKKRKIVGRGGRHAKTSGRGTKGQNARAGRKKWPELRSILKKLPKRRGYTFGTISKKAHVVNLSNLSKLESGSVVTPTLLRSLKLVSFRKNEKPVIKILGNGEISVPLSFSGCTVSSSAKEKIEKAGGKIS